MKRLNPLLLVALLVMTVGVGASMIASAQNPTPIQLQAIARPNFVGWEYARLVINGDNVLWHAGETNVIPEAVTLDLQYRRLGGNARPNLTNLLNVMGRDGWELVTTNETIWTFKRQR